MARIRTIKPEFPQSESMGNVSRDARLCFVMLWTIADDSGRLRGNSRMLASLLFPYDDDAPALIDGWLVELEKEGCIARYSVDGASYVEIAKWLSHQKIDKPSPSKIPAFDPSSRILANPRESSALDQGSKDQGSKDQGEEGASQRQPRATRKCPESFLVTDELRQWAGEKFPTVGLDSATEVFRDHTFKNAISDWPGAWRNWIRKDAEFHALRPAARAESFRQQDKKAAEQRWAAFTGNASDRDVIDVTPQTLELEHVYSDQSR